MKSITTALWSFLHKIVRNFNNASLEAEVLHFTFLKLILFSEILKRQLFNKFIDLEDEDDDMDRARQGMSKQKEREALALMIYNQFIAMRGEFPVNISHPVRKALQVKFEQVAHQLSSISRDSSISSLVDVTTFDDAFKEVYEVLERDAFRRFVKTKQWEKFLATQADFSGVVVVMDPSSSPGNNRNITSVDHSSSDVQDIA